MSQPPQFDNPNKIQQREEIMKFVILQFPALSSYFHFLGPNILLSTIFKHSQSPFFPQGEDQVSYQHVNK